MKKVFKSAILVSVAAAGLSLAACDGPRENAAEDAGEQNAEAVTDQAEAAADAGQITDEQAQAATDQAEANADAMEKQGEAADKAAGQ
jgi:hypothetical protein